MPTLSKLIMRSSPVKLLSGILLKFIRIAIIGSVLVISQAAGAETGWLQKMVTAAQTLDYQGSFLYARSSDIQLMKIRHRLIGGAREERIWHINGASMEIIRKGNILSCFHPENTNISLDHTIPSGAYSQIFDNQFEQGLDHYLVEQVGLDRIAEKDAILLVVMPKENNRYSYRLWLEKNTNLLLRSETIDLDMNVLEQFQFVNLELNPEFKPMDFQPQLTFGGNNHKELIPAKTVNTGFKSINWVVSSLPIGYELQMTSAEPNEMLSYSDGLSSFSIFIESKDMGMPETQQSMGATWIVTRHKKDSSLTLIGEIPLSTAENILSSLNKIQ